ncbi:uncharacterized protein F4817DRAFT_366313 [Daldinia loculata]|uniref:uncharacterized protein n=1 Tax=Daldinia loculata TaxID=103429 RepID=UPI0020C22D23|nr:uncharacterized protein F4817DRAFT_366313 [Daldinia loculata]KAI1645928.1 hypothetical protein F4817DRAFT_366313 [Daldinia loculata]
MSKLWPLVVVPHAPRTSASFENHLMLQLGQYSDAVVTCGTSSWNVHLNIIATRCAWFERQFSEARSHGSNEVVVSAHPFVAYKVIVWIYTKTLDLHESFKGVAEAFRMSLNIWDMANRLRIFDLMVACQEKLKSYLRNMVTSMQRMKCSGKLPLLDVICVCSGVSFAYKKGHIVLRNIFLDFVKDSQLWVLDVPGFQTAMAAIPGFQKDVADLVGKSPELRTFKPDVCTQCNKDPFAEGDSSHYAHIKSEDGKFTAICYRCHLENLSKNRTVPDVISKGVAGLLQYN